MRSQSRPAPLLANDEPDASPGVASSDLKSLLEAYERSLILAALGAVAGRQRSAAALLRILPTTLNEKMKRLGIGRQRIHRVAALDGGEATCASLRWSGTLPPGGTLELRGLNGPVRIEASDDEQVEVFASRRGEGAVLSAIEVKIVEHSRGVTVCAVCQGQDPERPARFAARGIASVRVHLLARVPPGVHVVASTVNGDIEVVGLASNVEAGTANGRVRFLPAAPHAAPGGAPGGHALLG